MIATRINEIHGDAAVEVSNDTESRDTTGQASLNREELSVQEELTVGGSGWIYHPAFLEVAADLGVLFNQSFTDSKQGQSTETTVNQFNYDVRLGVLPYKPYPVSLFASQLRTQTNSPFSPRIDIDTFRYGAGLTLLQLGLADWKLPTRMMYRHYETDTSSLAGARDDRRERDELEFITHNETERTRNNLRYDWASLSSKSQGTQASSSRHNLRLSQQRELQRGNLSSRFRLTKRTGSFDTLSLALDENLDLSHEHSFDSTYSYSLNYQDSRGPSQITHSGSAGLSHQLYKSLASSVRVDATYAEFGNGTMLTGGGGGQLNYTKRIPGGSFGLRFSPNYHYTEEKIESGSAPIHTAEEHLGVELNVGLTEIRLQHPNVLEIIEVTTDPVGVVYTTRSDEDFTYIQIDPISNPGVTSLDIVIEYTYNQPARSFSTLMLTSGFSIRLWDHYSADVNYTTIDQDLFKGDREQSTLDDSRSLAASVQANYDHSRTRFEYERTRASIDARERYGVTQNFDYRPERRTALGIAAGYHRDRRMNPDRVSETISSSASVTTVLPLEILARLNLLFRWVDQVEQRSMAAGPALSLTYRYGRFRLQLTDRFSWRRVRAKRGTERTTREYLNTVFFRIERPF